MSPPGRKTQAREDLKEKILEAARELIVKEGYEGVSMRKIGARIGYTAMALYRYFADKDTILRELCLVDFRTFRLSMESILDEPDLEARLRKMGRAYVTFAQDSPDQYRLLFMTPLPKRVDVQKVLAEHPEEDCYRRLRAILEEGVSAARFKPEYSDPDLISQVFWAGLHGIVSLHIVLRRAPGIEWRPLATTADAIINALIAGLTRSD